MQITDQTGRRRNLRLVATLAHSIFQSEMLMSEGNFRRLFPRQAGFGAVLVETREDKEIEPVRKATLRAQTSGFVSAVGKTADGRILRDADFVKKGQVLLVCTSDTVSARSATSSAVSRLLLGYSQTVAADHNAMTTSSAIASHGRE